MKYNKAKWLTAAACSLLLLAGFGCQDTFGVVDTFGETTLDKAGKDVYLTITPADASIAVGRDTLEMTCKVEDVDGARVKDAKITWSSEDESVARFVEGTNRLVGVRAGAGKTVLIKATLPNGRYATTKVTVLKNQLSNLSLFLNEKTLVGDIVYLPTGEFLDLLAVVTPDYLLKDNDVRWDVGESGITIEPIVLRPQEGGDERDQKKIDKLPKGGTWYKLNAGTAQNGEYTVHLRLGELSVPVRIKVGPALLSTTSNIGELLYKFAFDRKEFKLQDRATVMDITSKDIIEIYAEMQPATQEAFDLIKDEVKWTVEGNAGRLVSTSAEMVDDLFKFVANVETRDFEGEFKVSCHLQGKTVAQTVTVKHFAMQPFEELMFVPATISDLSVGEERRVRVRVQPRSSTSVIVAELREAIKKGGIASVVSYSNPGVLEVKENNGDFSLKGISTGKTDIIFTVRGKQFVWKDVQTIPKPRTLLFDNTTPNVVMVGDEVEWIVRLTMEGADQPDWARVAWSIIEGNAVSFVDRKSVGERVRLRAIATLPKGKDMVESNIRVQYAKSDKKEDRKIRVVPLQQSVAVSSSDYDLNDSGIVVSGGQISSVLAPLKTVDANRVGLLPTGFYIDVEHLEEKAYDAATVPVHISWINGLKKQAKSGTIVIKKAGEKYDVTLDLTLVVGTHQFKVTGSIEGLQKA